MYKIEQLALLAIIKMRPWMARLSDTGRYARLGRTVSLISPFLICLPSSIALFLIRTVRTSFSESKTIHYSLPT